MDPDGRNAIPTSEKVKKASIKEQIEYYQKQYSELLTKENNLKINIEQKKQENTIILNQRKEAYKETGYVIISTVFSLFQITQGKIPSSVTDFSMQDTAEFISDFDINTYKDKSFQQLIKDDISYLKNKFENDLSIENSKRELKKVTKEKNNALGNLLNAKAKKNN